MAQTDPRHKILSEHVLKLLEGNAAGAKITKIIAHAKSYIVFTSSRACPQYGQEHIRATQFFTVFQMRTRQKCLCKCSEKSCAQWRGCEFVKPLDARDRATLFPSGNTIKDKADQEWKELAQLAYRISAGGETQMSNAKRADILYLYQQEELKRSLQSH